MKRLNEKVLEELGLAKERLRMLRLTVALSQHYDILSEVAVKIRKIYRHSRNQTIRGLIGPYHAMEKEAKQVSKTIHKWLPNYDHEILQGVAVLRDPIEDDQPCYCN